MRRKTSLTEEQFATVLAGVKKGIASVRASLPDDDTLWSIVVRAERGSYAKNDKVGLAGFGFVMGKRWAIDAFHRANAAKAAKERAAEKEAHDAALTGVVHLSQALREEFYALATELSFTSTSAQLAQLDVLARACIEGQSHEELRRAHPGSSKDIIHQWKRRALLRMYPLASPALQEVLHSCRAGQRFTKQLVKGEPVVVYGARVPRRLEARARKRPDRIKNLPTVSVATLVAERESIEREAVREALNKTGGNLALAAGLLGMSRKTLYNKIRKFGFDKGPTRNSRRTSRRTSRQPVPNSIKRKFARGDRVRSEAVGSHDQTYVVLGYPYTDDTVVVATEDSPTTPARQWSETVLRRVRGKMSKNRRRTSRRRSSRIWS